MNESIKEQSMSRMSTNTIKNLYLSERSLSLIFKKVFSIDIEFINFSLGKRYDN